MFDTSKIKSLRNRLNSLSGPGSSPEEPARDSLGTPAKITAATLDASENVYNYTWVSLKSDGSASAEGGTSGARCIQERGVNMSGKDPTAPVGSIVYMNCDADGYHFAVGGGSSLGSEDPDYALSGSWSRSGATAAVNFGVMSDLVVDYNQNQAYAVILRLHFDTNGGCFQITTSQVPVFNLIAINQ